MPILYGCSEALYCASHFSPSFDVIVNEPSNRLSLQVAVSTIPSGAFTKFDLTKADEAP